MGREDAAGEGEVLPGHRSYVGDLGEPERGEQASVEWSRPVGLPL